MLCGAVLFERYTVPQLHRQPSCRQRLRMLSHQRTVGHMQATGGLALRFFADINVQVVHVVYMHVEVDSMQ